MDEIHVSSSSSQHQQRPSRGDKRRAPYAARACDACRRRKGRCDGRKPCEHCLGRSLECIYTPQPSDGSSSHSYGSGGGGPQHGRHDMMDGVDDPMGNLSGLVLSLQDQLNTLTAFMKDHQRQQAQQQQSQNQSQSQTQDQQQQTVEPPSAAPPSSQSTDKSSRDGPGSSPLQENDTKPSASSTGPGASVADENESPPAANSAIKRTSLPFYGPTSPEYSLNAAKITMSSRQRQLLQQRQAQQQGGCLPPHQQQQQQPSTTRPRVPSLADEMTDEDSGGTREGGDGYDEEEDDEDQCSTLVEDGDRYSIVSLDKAARQPVYLSRGLLRFANELSKKETTRLLGVYQEIIGSIHPICDVDALTRQLDRWYGISPSQGQGSTRRASSTLTTRAEVANETDQLLMLGLALATALSAESVSRSELARDLYDGFKDTATSRLITAAVTTDKDVVITLMMGFYEYFNGRLQHAWRMCGLAGRMAMQLGMHSREISQRNESQGRFAELATVTTTLVILDRQWSAAAGLPPNFQMTDFDSAQPDAVSHPYLKAMMSFTLMSHSFNEPVTRVASGETSSINDDALDLVVFQVEQWRRRTLEKQKFVHPRSWESAAAAVQTPSWMTMLYLRANAVRGILLRPYFLSSTSTPSPSAARKISPALELITDSVDTLSVLDRFTDTYRKQHPQFQHFLASGCALLFLVIAYAEQNRAFAFSELPGANSAWYADKIRYVFRKALALSASYRTSSAASRRLWKRLVAMKEPLVRQGILMREEEIAEGRRKSSVAVRVESAVQKPIQSVTPAPPQLPFQPSSTNDSVMDRAMLYSAAGNKSIQPQNPGPEPSQSTAPNHDLPAISTTTNGSVHKASAFSTANAAAAAQALINLNPTAAPSALSTTAVPTYGVGGNNSMHNAAPDTEELNYLDFSRLGNHNNANHNGGYTQHQHRQSIHMMDTNFGANNLGTGDGSDGAMHMDTSGSGDTDLLTGGNGPPLTNEYFAGLDWPTCDGVYFFSEGRLFDI